MKRKLIMITKNFPYGKGEVYLEREIDVFSKHFKEIHLFPVNKAPGDLRPLPANVKLNNLIADYSGFTDKGILTSNILTVIKILFLEYIHTNAKAFFIKNIKATTAAIAKGLYLADKFQEHNIISKNDTYYYSVWMDEGALLFSLLKGKKKINDFVFRLHGYDLYDERRAGNYMPFRYYNFKNAKKIFIVSKAGKNYLLKKNIFPDKIEVNYSGVFDNGNNPLDAQSFTIVSVSNLYKLKRIDKIIEVLHHIKFPINWIHIGDGRERESLVNLASKLPDNVKWKFMGEINQQELINFFNTNSVNLFLHLSKSEGLPLAIVEANSFGIPAMACNVGGVSEIINQSNGILIPEEFDILNVAERIEEFRKSAMNTIDFRKEVKAQWKEKFNAESNYDTFCQQIMENN